jgi:hypothetical protein
LEVLVHGRVAQELEEALITLLGALDAVFAGPLLEGGPLGHHDGHEEVLERVSIDERLGDVGRLSDLVLYLLWDDVLSLRELEDVLLSIDDLEGALGDIELADVASVDPALSVEGLLGHLRLAVVALEGDSTAVADFAARDRVAPVVCVRAQVVHVGDIQQLDLD